ncbi:hypothetical protein QE152_g27793 [Popillia japonica]|uniref:Uncharacterized protein n=1 Tax=Popillia japonica TaxID=7064 RepID=A0AAW1JLA4_POPJA
MVSRRELPQRVTPPPRRLDYGYLRSRAVYILAVVSSTTTHFSLTAGGRTFWGRVCHHRDDDRSWYSWKAATYVPGTIRTLLVNLHPLSQHRF